MIDPQVPIAPWLEEAWMQRYLQKELSEAETAAFEAYCLERTHLLACIEADNALRDVLATNRDQIAPLPAQPVKRRLAGLSRSLAVAACLLVGIVVGASAWPILTPDVSVDGEVTRIFFDTDRSTASTVRVDHPNSLSQFVLVDIVVPPGANQVRARIGDGDWAAISVANDGVGTLLVERKLLAGAAGLTLAYALDRQVVERPLSLPPLRFRSDH